MKKASKLTTLFLALIMILPLAACGNGQPDIKEAVPDDQSAPGKMAYEGAPLDKWEGVDLGGRKFVIAQGSRGKYTSTKEPRPVMGAADDIYETTIYRWENIQRISEKYNCEVEYLVINDSGFMDLAISSIMAGDPAFDIAQFHSTSMMPLYSRGFVLPYEDTAPEDADIWGDEMYVFKRPPINGKHYLMDMNEVLFDGWVLGVNLDIIDAIGAENPVELYEKGEWTWDKFLEICKMATQDIDGCGYVDQWGYCGPAQTLASSLIVTNSGSMINPDTHKQEFDTVNTMEALQFVADMYTLHDVAYSTYASFAILGDPNHDYNGNKNAFKEGLAAFFSVRL